MRRRGFVLVAVLYVAVLVGVTVPSPLYGLFQDEYALTTTEVTALFATYPVGVLLVLVFTGTWSDAIGRRPCLLIAAVASMASSLAFLLANDALLLFAGRALTGVASGFVVASATAALVELAPAHGKAAASVTSSVLNQVGLGVGALAAGVAADQWPAPTRAPFATHALVVAVAVSALWWVPETAPRSGRPSVSPASFGLPSTGRTALLAACAAGFAAFAMCGLLAALAPFLVSTTLGAGHYTATGVAVFTIFTTSALSQPLWAPLDPNRMMRWALATLIVALIGLAASIALGSGAGLFAAVAWGGLGVGGVFMGSLRTVSALPADHERGRVTSAYFVATFAGLVVPVVGTGLLADAYGLETAAVVFSVAICLVCLGCLWPFIGRTHQTA